jgi:hypothetical protein
MTMRYLSIVKGLEKMGQPPKALLEAIGKFGAEAVAAGTLIETGGLRETATGARVRIKSGKLIVKDGPFTESKEVIGGFAVLEYASRQEAIEGTVKFMQLHRDHWPSWEGEAEIREMCEAPSFAPSPAKR